MDYDKTHRHDVPHAVSHHTVVSVILCEARRRRSFRASPSPSSGSVPATMASRPIASSRWSAANSQEELAGQGGQAGYDLAGRMLSASDAAAGYAYAYDATGPNNQLLSGGTYWCRVRCGGQPHAPVRRCRRERDAHRGRYGHYRLHLGPSQPAGGSPRSSSTSAIRSSHTGRMTPRSQMRAVMSPAGVTSNAGL